MAEPIQAQVSGLQLSNNTFTASPPGAQYIARNGCITQKGVWEPRRGQKVYTEGSGLQYVFSMTEFQNFIIANSMPSRTSDTGELGYLAPTFTPYNGVYSPVDLGASGRMKFAQAGGFLHFATQSDGPRVLETAFSLPRAAGLPRMPDLQGHPVSTSVLAPGVVPYNAAVAYRSLMRLPLQLDGGSILGPPSARTVVANRILVPVAGLNRAGGTTVTGTLIAGVTTNLAIGDTFVLSPGEANFPAGTYTVASTPGPSQFTYASAGANVASTLAQDIDVGARSNVLTVPLPPEATSDMRVRLYRSKASSSSSVSPNDELFLVAEVAPDGTDISNGYVTIQDSTPASQLIDPLYTNPQTGAGLDQSNFRPPVYRDVANWGSRNWYANTTGQQSFRLAMLGVDPDNGVQQSDTITIDGEVFDFHVAAGAPPQVQIQNGGLPGFNIAETTANLIAVINSWMDTQGNNIRAYGNSAQDENPGKILLQRSDSTDQTVFTVDASRVETWTPALPQDSAAATAINGLAWSKLSEPEAVPAVNFLAVGSKNYPIYRLLPLRNALIVCKGGDGIYSITGNAGEFQVQQISTANVTSIDCCAIFADLAWCYTDQGILAVSDSGGTSVKSRAIETELNELQAAQPGGTKLWGFAVPYETERKILFYLPTDDDDTHQLAWVYSLATNSWSTCEKLATSGLVATDAALATKLVLGVDNRTFNFQQVLIERKNFDKYDYADEEITNAVVSSAEAANGATLVQLSNELGIEVGDGFQQDLYESKIRLKRDDLGQAWFELWESIPVTPDPCTIFRGYPVEAQFLPVGNPANRKVLTRLAWLARQDSFASYDGKTTIFTDQLQAELEISTPSRGFGWGGFGNTSFGDPSALVVDVNPIAASHTNAAQFYVGFKTSEAWAKEKLEGFMLKLDDTTAPVGRGK